ncbi:ParB/RepB/Spo0J family partition protein [Noviherbaspirillum sp. L7-7A]|uniref:ParB/RepB/Spo0J family partition protein n=1 Tax=Noviherbaspirillum sp. L7-7A TaxID=2850560 RepID=UPI001C2C17D4|nr:ParB/RepB/Spo0J family partition protein [Noviherbaspirillum sp. L7-7A]MBV0881977.1 ParB/RepB/Spo0J family partition protein [Noviherbaspirillum sp. L7-7A]
MKQRLAPRMPLASLKTFDQTEAVSKSFQDEQAVTEPRPMPDPASLSGHSHASAAEIPIALIDKSPHQPRLIFDPEAIDALAASISESGLMSPITVKTKENGRYELIGGERRLRAHQILGKQQIPAFVLENISVTDAAIGALADNEAKRSLCDYERGKAYRRTLTMSTEAGKPLTQGTLARRIGVSDATISRCLAFFDLPQEAIAMLDEKPNLIGAKNAASLVTLAKKGHSRIVIQALRRISHDGASEQGAVNWATGEVNRLSKTTQAAVALKIKGQHFGDVVVDGSRLIINCKNGYAPEEILSRLLELAD